MHIMLGISCFVSSVLFAVLVIFLNWTLFSRIGTAKLEQIKNGNKAAAVVLGSELLAFGILMKSCLYPVSAVLQDFFMHKWTGTEFLRTLGYMLGYFMLGYALSVLTVFISARLFQLLTRRLDEKKEIANGNIAVAIVLGLVIITVSVMAQFGLSNLLNTLIPPPDSGIVSFSE